MKRTAQAALTFQGPPIFAKCGLPNSGFDSQIQLF
jgi:hypothetical protein